MRWLRSVPSCREKWLPGWEGAATSQPHCRFPATFAGRREVARGQAAVGLRGHGGTVPTSRHVNPSLKGCGLRRGDWMVGTCAPPLLHHPSPPPDQIFDGSLGRRGVGWRRAHTLKPPVESTVRSFKVSGGRATPPSTTGTCIPSRDWFRDARRFQRVVYERSVWSVSPLRYAPPPPTTGSQPSTGTFAGVPTVEGLPGGWWEPILVYWLIPCLPLPFGQS